MKISGFMLICSTAIVGTVVVFASSAQVRHDDKTIINQTEATVTSQSFDEVSPWAVFLIYGSLADLRSNVIAVDCDAVSNSNITAQSTLFHEDGWYGLRNVGRDNSDFFIFKYRVVKRLQEGNLVHCSYRPSGSGSFGCFLLLRLQRQRYRYEGIDESRLVLSAHGYYSNRDEVLRDYPELWKVLPREKNNGGHQDQPLSENEK